jgi:hypothetical protein
MGAVLVGNETCTGRTLTVPDSLVVVVWRWRFELIGPGVAA